MSYPLVELRKSRSTNLNYDSESDFGHCYNQKLGLHLGSQNRKRHVLSAQPRTAHVFLSSSSKLVGELLSHIELQLVSMWNIPNQLDKINSRYVSWLDLRNAKLPIGPIEKTCTPCGCSKVESESLCLRVFIHRYWSSNSLFDKKSSRKYSDIKSSKVALLQEESVANYNENAHLSHDMLTWQYTCNHHSENGISFTHRLYTAP